MEFRNKITPSYPRFMLQHLALEHHTYSPPLCFLAVIKTRTVYCDFKQASSSCLSKDRLTLQAKRLVDIFLKYQLGVLFVHGKDFAEFVRLFSPFEEIFMRETAGLKCFDCVRGGMFHIPVMTYVNHS